MKTVIFGVWGLLLLASPVLAKDEARSKAPAPAGQMAEAQGYVKGLYGGVWKIERVLEAAGNRALRASCVAEKLADAKAHLRIGTEELARMQASMEAAGKGARASTDRGASDRSYALARLGMLAQRTRDAERAAEVCINDDASGVDITMVSVEIAPPVGGGDEAARKAAPPAAVPAPVETKLALTRPR